MNIIKVQLPWTGDVSQPPMLEQLHNNTDTRLYGAALVDHGYVMHQLLPSVWIAKYELGVWKILACPDVPTWICLAEKAD